MPLWCHALRCNALWQLALVSSWTLATPSGEERQVQQERVRAVQRAWQVAVTTVPHTIGRNVVRKADRPGNEGCGRDFMQELKTLASASGWLTGNDEGIALTARGMGCSTVGGGGFAALQFDLLAYIDRSLAYQDTGPDAREGLIRMRHFYTQEAGVLEDIVQGVGLCLPASCLRSSKDELATKALLYFVCVAGSSCSGIEQMRAPLDGTEMNVTVHAIFDQEDESRWIQPKKTSTVPQKTPSWPWWLACQNMPVAGSWRFLETLLEDFRENISKNSRSSSSSSRNPRFGVQVPRAIVEEADKLVEQQYQESRDWITWALLHTQRTCSFEHIHFFGEQARPLQWKEIERWKSQTGFCPHAYTVALFVRAFSRWSIGMLTSAADDLSLARGMMGGCSQLESEEYHCCAEALLPFATSKELQRSTETKLNCSTQATGTEEARVSCSDLLLRYGASVLFGKPPEANGSQSDAVKATADG